MRFYTIILSDIVDVEHDTKFYQYIIENNFEFWRYTALNYIIATPNTVSTNQITQKLVEAYGAIFFVVLEININDVGGIAPNNLTENNVNPFRWFADVMEKNYVPKWEKNKTKETE